MRILREAGLRSVIHKNATKQQYIPSIIKFPGHIPPDASARVKCKGFQLCEQISYHIMPLAMILKNLRNILLGLLIILGILGSSCSRATSSSPHARHGVLDLRG